MKLTEKQKSKLKKVLFAISTDEERDKLTQADLLANLVGAVKTIDEKTRQQKDELVSALEKNKNISVKHNSVLLQSLIDSSEDLNKKLEEIREISKIPKGDVFGPEKAKDSNLAAFDGSGKKIKDSGIETDKLKSAISKIDKFEKGGGRWQKWLGGSDGHKIQEEGATLTQRAKLNFVGGSITATDDPTNNATVITADLSGYVPYTGATADVIGYDFVSLRGSTITRNGSSFITRIIKTGGRTIDITRDVNNIITSWTDGSHTWTPTRTGGFISSIAVT